MYKERREKLRQQMPDYSITVMFSGRPVHGDGDEFYPFKVNRTFYYFTGIERQHDSGHVQASWQGSGNTVHRTV